MKEKSVLKALTSTLIVGLSAKLALHAQEAQPYQGVVGRTLAESKEWWPDPVKAPGGSPNVVWILLDDVGFGAASAFGGLISTPTFDNLANNGLRYHIPFPDEIRLESIVLSRISGLTSGPDGALSGVISFLSDFASRLWACARSREPPNCSTG
jgi:hypothetical protein